MILPPSFNVAAVRFIPPVTIRLFWDPASITAVPALLSIEKLFNVSADAQSIVKDWLDAPFSVVVFVPGLYVEVLLIRRFPPTAKLLLFELRTPETIVRFPNTSMGVPS